MSPSTKKLALYALATGFGSMLVDQDDRERVRFRALKLQEAGQDALDNAKIKLDNSKTKLIEHTIHKFMYDGMQFKIINALCFLITGLCDLELYIKNDARFNSVLKRAQWLLEIFDTKLNQNEIYNQAVIDYEEWIKL